MSYSIQELEAILQEADSIKDETKRNDAWQENLKNYRGDDEIISFADAMKLTQEEYSGFSAKTGIAGLDGALKEIRENDLVIITGDPGAGKTTLAMSITANMSDNGIAGLWFSMEVGLYDFLRKFGNRLPNGFTPKSIINRNMVWIERRIVEGIAKFNTRVVFIDNFNALDDYYSGGKGEPMSIHLGNLAMKIKKIALKYHIIIVLLVHSGKAESGQIVSWKNIRDSQLIANACDSIIVVWRKEKRGRGMDGLEYEPFSVAAVQKNRRFGDLGKSYLQVKDGLFYEATKKYEDYEKSKYATSDDDFKIKFD